jgi:hypothetical protein
MGRGARKQVRETARRELRQTDVAAALMAAWALSTIGFRRVGQLKAVATRFLMR